MPALTAVTESNLIALTAQALVLRQDEGLSVKEACRKVGITDRQFYRLLTKAEPLIAAIRDAHSQLLMEELAMIMVNRADILAQVIDDAVAPTTFPEVRLEILMHLESRLPYLLEATAPVDSSGILDILGPPVQKPGVSRFSNNQLEIEEVSGGIIIRAQQPDVIDITPQEPEEQERNQQ